MNGEIKKTKEEVIKEYKPPKVNEDESDWDFDFSMYEKEEKEENEEVESHVLKDAPPIQLYRSRWSNWDGELQRLTELNKEISKRAIKVSSRSQDIRDLYNLFGVVEELWSILKPIQGQVIIEKVESMKKNLLQVLVKYQNGGSIPEYVYEYLLQMRDLVYKVKQFSGLGFEVERTRRGDFAKAKDRMIN